MTKPSSITTEQEAHTIVILGLASAELAQALAQKIDGGNAFAAGITVTIRNSDDELVWTNER